MSIGYACLTLGLRDMKLQTCLQKSATEERLTSLISHNLDVLKSLIIYNKNMGIHLFRISSDLIPFGSSPVNTLDWETLFKDRFEEIGLLAAHANIRLSMHPGQYTVLNSPENLVVQRSILDLEYHCKILDLLGTNSTHKIIIHVGGVYGNKENSMHRFVENYQKLDQTIKNRLVIENDDKCFNIQDVLEIGQKIKAPVVFDNLHHWINYPGKVKYRKNLKQNDKAFIHSTTYCFEKYNECNEEEHFHFPMISECSCVLPSNQKQLEKCLKLAQKEMMNTPLGTNTDVKFIAFQPVYWMKEAIKTWGKQDGNPKIHYSQPANDKRLGSHSQTIQIKQFLSFLRHIPEENVDIMLEVKDKNLSAIKCNLCFWEGRMEKNSQRLIGKQKPITFLEQEWSKYKYSVLERSSSHYQQIRELLKDKNKFLALDFYSKIEEAFQKPIEIGASLNGLFHVWGYFKADAIEPEKAQFRKLIERYELEQISLHRVKTFLEKLAIKYDRQYLLDSYYFILEDKTM